MTLTSDIITDAYRESNLIAIGATPNAAQVAEGLRRLNVIVSGVYGYEVGEPLNDWPIGKQGLVDEIVWERPSWQYPPSNVRFIAASNEPETVYLNPNPADGARVALIDPLSRLATYPITLDGNGRAIEGSASVTLNTDDLVRTWLYRAEIGQWLRLSDLDGAIDEEFPFPKEFDDFFTTRLAMRLNPRYGRQMSEESAAELIAIRDKIKARYRQPTTVWGDPGAAMLTSNFSPYLFGQQGDRGYTLRGRRYRHHWMD